MAEGTAIVNVALRRIGVTRIDDLLTDKTREAIAARDVYDETRRELLASHNWKFAIKRVALTASAIVPAFGWDAQYPLPDDFIRLIAVHPGIDDNASMPYRLEFGSGGDDRSILANGSSAANPQPIYIRYVFDQQETNVFSPQFRTVLAYRLSMELAAALNRPIDLEQFNEVSYLRMLARAKSVDGMQDYPERMDEGNWSQERDSDGSGWNWGGV